ncbi:hypothetical protein J7K74_03855 [Candidatus Woesearchaeota archaeon]|nr:hypothetical protein [Candidatus Woesearchaeota archaeon]
MSANINVVEIIPPELLDKKKIKELLAFIAKLPVDIWTKKYILIDALRIIGVALEKWMVDYITGYRSSETWG